VTGTLGDLLQDDKWLFWLTRSDLEARSQVPVTLSMTRPTLTGSPAASSRV